MELLNDIRADLVNESARIVNTLRKARVLAYEVQSPELRQWVISELDGYSDFEKVPDYRRIALPVFGTFNGPGGARMRDVLITTSGLPVELKEVSDILIVPDGVAVIEGLLESGEEALTRMLLPEITQILRRTQTMSGGMILFESYQKVPRGNLLGVLDSVKTRLLDFVLDLQERTVTSEGVRSGEIPPEVVREAAIYNFYGGNNVVATGGNAHQEVKNVYEGNFDSLVEHLKGYKVSDEDIIDLKEAFGTEPVRKDGKFGSKVSAWIGTMISKAASGAWEISADKSSEILVKALQLYSGA